MGKKSKEIRRLMDEKKCLESLFIKTSLLSLLICLLDFHFIDKNESAFIGGVIVTVIFLIVMKIRIDFEVRKELDHIEKKYEN